MMNMRPGALYPGDYYYVDVFEGRLEESVQRLSFLFVLKGASEYLISTHPPAPYWPTKRVGLIGWSVDFSPWTDTLLSFAKVDVGVKPLGPQAMVLIPGESLTVENCIRMFPRDTTVN